MSPLFGTMAALAAVVAVPYLIEALRRPHTRRTPCRGHPTFRSATWR
jgi:hypothetical protein